jgi:hypothetical protein
MWIPNRAFELFHISKDTVDCLRIDLAAIRVERDSLKANLATTQANLEWIRVRVNALELERAQLLEKAYGVKVPVPEVIHSQATPLGFSSSIFEDMGEHTAKELGFPTYQDKN